MKMKRATAAKSAMLPAFANFPFTVVLSQVRGIKRLGKEIFHLNDFYFTFQIRHNHGNVAATFPDQLAASAAGRRQHIGVGYHGNGVEAALAFADGFENGDALGAHGEAISGILDVAAAKNPSGGGAKRGANTKIRVRCMRVFPGLPRGGNQDFVFAHEVFLANDTVASAPLLPLSAFREEAQQSGSQSQKIPMHAPSNFRLEIDELLLCHQIGGFFWLALT